MDMTEARARAALVGCCLAQFVLSVNGSIVNSALPDIQSDFHVDLTTLQWVVSAFVVTIAGLLTAAGSLADRIGRRRTMLLGFALLGVGSIACALAGDVIVLIGGRVVQAVGAAALATAGMAAVSGIFSDARARGAAVAWWAGVGTVALVAGPAIGGAVVGLAGWRAVFWLTVALCVAGAAIVVGALRESRADRPARFDALGQILLSALLVAVSVALLEGPREGWGSPLVIGMLVAAAMAIAATAVHVRRAAHPLIPPSLLRSVPYLGAAASALLGYALAGGMFFALPLYLQSTLRLSVGESALALLPVAGAALVAAVVSGRIVAAGRTRLDLVVAGLLLAGSAAALLVADGSLAVVVAASVVFGAGYGLIGDPLSVSALSALDPAEAGLASALFSTGKQFGQLLGIATVGIILGSATDDLASHFARAGSLLWAVFAVLGAAIALVNLVLGRRATATA